MNICSQCRQENNDEAKFCRGCGARLDVVNPPNGEVQGSLQHPFAGPAEADLIARIVKSGYDAKGWIKFLGVVSIIGGVLYVITIWGILICWLPIWLGTILLKASSTIEKAYVTNDRQALLEYSESIGSYFRVSGMALLIAIVVIGFALLFLRGSLWQSIGRF